MIALAVVGLGILGLLLISLFGDITVTNQQDYVLMKNSVEAAMYDSVDKVSYMKGFCVCTNLSETTGSGSKYVFKNTDEYAIETLYDDNTECDKFISPKGSYKTCEKFENFTKRFFRYWKCY